MKADHTEAWAQRLIALETAFCVQRAEDGDPSITRRLPLAIAGELVDPDRGLQLEFRSSNGAEGTLRINGRGARLRTRWVAQGYGAHTATSEDRLSVDLRTGYRWGEAVYETATELSNVLLEHTRRRLEALPAVSPTRSPTQGRHSRMRHPLGRRGTEPVFEDADAATPVVVP